jgi:type IV secretory pathway TrbL component
VSFFRTSFANIGEALKTISLAIAVLGAMLSGIGYVYGTLSAQKAMAEDITAVTERVGAIELARKDSEVWRFRIAQTEKGVNAANQKLDRIEDTLNDLRVQVGKNR